MLPIIQLHAWNLTPAEARAVQRELAGRVVTRGGPRQPRLVAGVDMAIAGGYGVAAAVVLSTPDLELVDSAVAAVPLAFPYVPGLLSFRELPVVLQAVASLTAMPELILVDGQGRLHPRRFGIACHLGILLGCPTIGCGKSLLCGTHRVPAAAAGSQTAVRDHGETIGCALRTQNGVKPIYVSIGHRVSLRRAVALTLAMTRRYRLPEPVRQAHLLAAQAKREGRFAAGTG